MKHDLWDSRAMPERLLAEFEGNEPDFIGLQHYFRAKNLLRDFKRRKRKPKQRTPAALQAWLRTPHGFTPPVPSTASTTTVGDTCTSGGNEGDRAAAVFHRES